MELENRYHTEEVHRFQIYAQSIQSLVLNVEDKLRKQSLKSESIRFINHFDNIIKVIDNSIDHYTNGYFLTDMPVGQS